MVEHGWNHVTQVDIISKVIEDSSQRFSTRQQQKPEISAMMDCIEDDARTLSAFNDTTMDAVIDKGLIDALYLADEYDQISEIMSTVDRVLKPNGVFLVFSLSDPNYLSPTLLGKPEHDLFIRESSIRQQSWQQPITVHSLETVFLYKCQKVPEPKHRPIKMKKRRK